MTQSPQGGGTEPRPATRQARGTYWLRPLLLVVGEGALAGALAGIPLALWREKVNQDFAFHQHWLAFQRLQDSVATTVMAGVAASLVIALVLEGLRRGGARALRAGRLFLVGSFIAVGAAALGPLASFFFPLAAYYSRYPQTAMVAMTWTLAMAAILLAARLLGFRAGAGRLTLSRLGVVLAAMLALALPARPYLDRLRASDRPSVILISIDALRADHVGKRRQGQSLTPTLDRLAAEGASFSNAMAPAPWTLPSHASIFLSRFPIEHGIRWSHSRIHPSRVTLTEILRNAGYRTAGITGGAFVSAKWGFGQGFEIYQEHDEWKAGEGPTPLVREALAWVRKVRRQPFFLFFHTYEAHSPFTHTDFARAEPGSRVSGGYDRSLHDAIRRKELILNSGERQYVRDLYAGDVASADSAIGSLLDGLREYGVLDRSIVVVLSDHGEEFWDREPNASPNHGHSLYQEVLHVPLIIRWLDRIHQGAKLDLPVSLIDVAPTLLSLAGIDPCCAMLGHSMSDALLLGREPELRPQYSESTNEGPERYSVRLGALKAIYAPKPAPAGEIGATSLEVFDLDADPAERINLADTPQAMPLIELALERSQLMETTPPPEEGDERFPPELLEQLRSLGYVD